MAAKIRRRIRLAEFFSADIRRTKIRRLIQIFGGGLGVYLAATDIYTVLSADKAKAGMVHSVSG